ncbi:MAG: T9SS type A sorting domain-containing protein [Haliscomenobacter sp.]|nr:T9SS type A sorting domain-containing protein [Haliscomenobacter sp.]
MPVRLAGIPVNPTSSSLTETLEVCADKFTDDDDSDDLSECCANIRYQVPCRPPVCFIRDLKVYDLKCDSLGRTYGLTLNLIAENAGDTLTVYLPGGMKKRVAVKDFPIRFEGIPGLTTNSLIQVIEVCADNQPYPYPTTDPAGFAPCCATIRFETPCKPQLCSITDVKATDIKCSEDGKSYSATLSWAALNAGDSLVIETNSGFRKVVSAKASPITLENIPVPANGGGAAIYVCSFLKIYPPCCGTVKFELPCRPQACSISDLKVTEIECVATGTTRHYNLTLNLKAVNAGDSLFVTTNSGYKKKIANKFPVRLTGIPFGQDSKYGILEVCSATPLTVYCCNKVQYELPCPPACAIRELKVYDVKCNPEKKTFSFSLNMIAQNPGEVLYLTTDGGFQTKIDPAKLPARIDNVPYGPEAGWATIKVCASNADDCCAKLRFPLPCAAPCSISDLKVSEIECITNGIFPHYNLTLNLKAINAGDSLIVSTDSGFKRKIANKFPARLTGIPFGQDLKFGSLEVCSATPLPVSCCNKIRYELPCPPACDIRDLKVFDIKCDPARKVYSFSVNLVAQNPGEVLYLETDGGFITKIDPKKLPARIENVPFGPEAGWATIKVCGSNVDECCAKLRFPVPCAAPVCSIRDLKVFDIKCSEDGKFYSLSLNLVAQNAGDSLVVTTDSGFKKVIPSNKWPYRLEGIPSGNYPYAGILEVCAYKPAGTAPCCEKIKYELPCRPQCSISDLKPLEIKCSADGKSYSMSLAFKAQYASDSLLVETLSGYRKVISSRQSPVRLENIPVGNDTQFGILTLCALSPSSVQQCCDKIRFELPCRTQTCDLGDLQIERTRCDEQGKFSFFLKFEHKNTSDSFLVLINGATKGKFAYSQLPVKFGPFQGPLTQPMNITVYDSQNRACSSFGILQPFRCETVCSLTDLKVFDIKCNNNGTYSLKLKLNAQNGGETLTGKTSTGYQFRFRTDEMPVKVEGIPVPRDGYDVIKICDPNHPDCCVELRYKVPCQEPCYLGPLTAEQLCQPNGLYFVRLNFGYNNSGKQFEVYVNGINYGIFTYDKLPVKVGPFFQTNVRELKILVKDKTLGCSTSTVLPVESCAGACSFNNLKAEVVSCENGKFYAGLSFQAPQADSSRAYLVFANGRIYGPYRYSQNPVKLGPFNANGITQYSFLVIDMANPTCYAYTTIKPVRCAGEECRISKLVVKPVDCKPDGSQRILVDFDHNGAPGGSFALSMNNGFIGNFDLDKLPLEVVVRKPVITTTDRLTEFSVCIRGTDNCCASVKTDLLECPVACREPQVAIDRKDCDSTGVFKVALKADDALDSNFFYAVFVDGQIRDTLNGANRTVEIGPFKGDSATIYKVEVVSYGLQRCVKTFKVGPIDCRGKKSDDVWPGDANQDNMANYIDLLNIGVAFGANGPSRKGESDQWAPFAATDWKQEFLTGQNYKHADTNGDGLVDEDDIKVVLKNYGKKHGVLQAAEDLPGTKLDPAIQLELPNGPLPAKGLFEIPIKLGAKISPVKNIYGLAFTLKVDPAVIDLSKVEVVVPISWMGQPGVNMAHIHKVYPAEGMIEIAISRIDQNEVSGYGVIAYLRGGIKDDIAGRSSDMSIRHGAAVRLNQETVPIQGSLMQLQVAPPATETTETPTPESIKPGLSIFPNPLTGDQLRIEHRLGMAIEEVQLMGIDGKPASAAIRGSNRVDLAGIPAGMYIVRIKIGGFNFFEKLIRQ